MKWSLIALLSLSTFFVSAQSFQRALESFDHTTSANGIIPINTNEYLIAGGFVNSTESKALLIRLNRSGDFIEAITYKIENGISFETFEFIDIKKSGNAYFISGFGIYFNGVKTAFILRMDENFSIDWFKLLGNINAIPLKNLLVDNDGNVVIAMQTPLDLAVRLTKFDPDGNVIFSKNFNGSATDDIWSISLAQNGDYLISGNTNSFSSIGKGFIIRTNNAGDLIWSSLFHDGSIQRVSVLQDGDLLVSGVAVNGALSKPILARLSDTGTPRWTKTLNINGESYYNYSVVSDVNFIYLVMNVELNGNVSPVLTCFDPDGNLLWSRIAGGQRAEDIRAVEFFYEGLVLAGNTFSFNIPRDIYVMQTDVQGDNIQCNNSDYCLEVENAGMALANASWSESIDFIAQDVLVDQILPLEFNSLPFCDVNGIEKLDFQMYKPALCLNECMQITNLSLGNGVDYSWRWSDETERTPGFEPADRCFDNTGMYSISIYAEFNGCIDSGYQEFIVTQAPRINLPDEKQIFCAGDSLVLNAFDENVFSYAWSDSSRNSSLTVYESGIYSLEARTEGCVFTDEVEVEVLDCQTCPIFMPNIFSPNGDNINDYFGPNTDCAFENLELQIFDRWGNQIFESSSAETNWNGRVGDKFAPAGVYVFVLKYVERRAGATETKILSGDLMLMR